LGHHLLPLFLVGLEETRLVEEVEFEDRLLVVAPSQHVPPQVVQDTIHVGLVRDEVLPTARTQGTASSAYTNCGKPSSPGHLITPSALNHADASPMTPVR